MAPHTEPADEQATDDPIFTLAEFCERNRLSRTTLFKLRRAGRGPTIMPYAGGRISAAAETAWRKEMADAAGSERAQIEAARRTEHARRAGRAAAASPAHVSKHQQGKSRSRTGAKKASTR